MDTQLAEKGTRNLWLLAFGGTAIVFGLLYLVEIATRSNFDELWSLVVLPLVLASLTHLSLTTTGRRGSMPSKQKCGKAVNGSNKLVVALF